MKQEMNITGKWEGNWLYIKYERPIAVEDNDCLTIEDKLSLKTMKGRATITRGGVTYDE